MICQNKHKITRYGLKSGLYRVILRKIRIFEGLEKAGRSAANLHS